MRNAVAFPVAVVAAFGLFDALASAGAAGSGLSPSPSFSTRLVVQAALVGLAGAVALWLGVRIAASPHVLYPPFFLLAFAAFGWLPWPWQRWPIGLGLSFVGAVVGMLSHLHLRSQRPPTAQA